MAQGKKNKSRSSGGRGGNKAASARGGITGLQIGLIVAAVLIVIGGATTGVIIGMKKGNGDSTIASSGIKLPDYAYGSTAPKGTAEAYQFAVDNQDVLKYIPCYCGCGELDGHTSNLDCFIKSGSGNNVVFDKHAAG
ncbi:MAG: PCYCGC motif-containing (lipo)protein [Thermoleophilia bacterium]